MALISPLNSAIPSDANLASLRRIISSAPAKAIDRVLDLSTPGRDVFGAIGRLNAEEREAFFAMLATLLRMGIVGIETVDVDGRPHQTFASTRMAARHLRGRPEYRLPRGSDRVFDART